MEEMSCGMCRGGCEGHHGMESCACGGGCKECLLKKAMTKALVKALAERIRSKLDQQIGDKLDQVAALTVETMMTKHKLKAEACKQKEELREKMREILGGEE